MIASIVKTYEAKSLSEVLDYTCECCGALTALEVAAYWTSDDLCVYVIWISIELNVVIIVSSIPLLRPLFRRRRRQQLDQADPASRWDSVTLGSVLSRKGPHAGATQLSSISSEENVLAPYQQPFPDVNQSAGITVTTEVSVTYQPNNAPFVHAALVGLVQGEIANPSLART